MTTRSFQLLVLAIGLAAAATVGLATKHGVGLSPDSATYIAGARQLARGHGLTTPQGGEPITHFPPLFPAIMAAPSLVGVDAIPTARVLNLLLLVLTTLLAGTIAFRSSGHSALAGLVAAGLFATSVDLLNVHAWAWSEPLLLCSGLAGLWLLQQHLWRPRRTLLLGGSLLIALAVLARYAGVTLVLTGLLGLVFTDPRPVRRRCVDAVILLAVTLAPLAVWMVRNKLVSQNATNREAVFHPVTIKQLTQGAQTVAGWIVPTTSARATGPSMAVRLGVPLTGLLVLGLVVVVILAVRHRSSGNIEDRDAPRVPRLFGIFIPVYTAFLLASLSWFDAPIPLDDRILSPLLAAIICFIVPTGVVAFGSLSSHGKAARVALSLGCLIGFGWFLYRDALWAREARQRGLGYASRAWRYSGVMAAIRALPADAFIYTNSPGAVLLLADRVCAYVPEKIDRNSTRAKKDYEGRMTYMRERLQGGAYLAYFRTVKSRHNLPTEEELQSMLPMVVQVDAGADGVIYRATPPTTKP